MQAFCRLAFGKGSRRKIAVRFQKPDLQGVPLGFVPEHTMYFQFQKQLVADVLEIFVAAESLCQQAQQDVCSSQGAPADAGMKVCFCRFSYSQKHTNHAAPKVPFCAKVRLRGWKFRFCRGTRRGAVAGRSRTQYGPRRKGECPLI